MLRQEEQCVEDIASYSEAFKSSFSGEAIIDFLTPQKSYHIPHPFKLSLKAVLSTCSQRHLPDHVIQELNNGIFVY